MRNDRFILTSSRSESESWSCFPLSRASHPPVNKLSRPGRSSSGNKFWSHVQDTGQSLSSVSDTVIAAVSDMLDVLTLEGQLLSAGAATSVLQVCVRVAPIFVHADHVVKL